MKNPTGIEIQVRTADIDGYGHVNNSVYVGFLQHALAQTLAQAGYDWDTSWDGLTAWRLASLSIEYRRPAHYGDELGVKTWLEQANPLTPVFGFEIVRLPAADTALVRAVGAWQQVSRADGQAIALADDLLGRLPVERGSPLRAFDLPADRPQSRLFTWRTSVGVHEIGPDQRAQPLALYNWFEEALFDACDQADWGLQRRLAANVLILQTRHDSRFYDYPGLREQVEITSRVVDYQRLRGSWMLDLRRVSDGALLARDISTGVFLDLQGRPSAPHPAMIWDIQNSS